MNVQKKSNGAGTGMGQENLEQEFINTIKHAPVGIIILRGAQFVVEMANPEYLHLVDRTEQEMLGKPLFESLPEVERTVSGLLNQVFTTGEPIHAMEFPVTLNRFGKEETGYFNFTYQAMRQNDGHISGVIVVANDVTLSVKAKHALAENESHFRNIVMQSPIPMTIFRGKEYIIEMANTAMFKNIWRKKEADVIGKSALQVFPELNAQKYPELMNNVLLTGIPYRETESPVDIQGDDAMRKFYLDYEYLPLFETDGSISGIMITVNDVTEKVSARKKVEWAEERLRLAAEATELATWELNLETRAILYSPRLAEIFGRPGSQLSHQQMRDAVHPNDRSVIVEKAFERAMATGYYFYEARIVLPNGEIRWISTRGKTYFDEELGAQKLIGTLRDITEDKNHQLEQQDFTQKLEQQVQERTHELEQKNNALEKMNADLQSFAYVSSHDLQEPLRKIQTFASRIMEKEASHLSEKGMDYFQRMQDAARRMQMLIEDLLSYSRTNITERIFHPFPLEEMVQEVTTELKDVLQEKQAIVEVKEPCTVQVIHFQFRQLLYNLIGNAIKFSRKEVPLRISICSHRVEAANAPSFLDPAKGYTHIVFSDNGIGFDPQYRERIFEVFQRLHGKSEYQGTGIGLAIVKKIVENHHGFITADSEQGKGTSFHIYLPE